MNTTGSVSLWTTDEVGLVLLMFGVGVLSSWRPKIVNPKELLEEPFKIRTNTTHILCKITCTTPNIYLIIRYTERQRTSVTEDDGTYYFFYYHQVTYTFCNIDYYSVNTFLRIPPKYFQVKSGTLITLT